MWTLGEKISFIERCFGTGSISRDGLNLSVRCPICDDPRPNKKKLAIRTDIDVCHCWVCGFKSRSLVALLKKYCSADYLAEYRQKFFQEVAFGDKITENAEEQSKILSLPTDFKLIASHGHDRSDPDIWNALKYLRFRGIEDEDLWYFKFGVSHSDSRYANRVIMPSFDVDGKLNFITARAWGKSYQPYQNCETDRLTVVFNEININWAKTLNLVEGPFDYIKCPQNSTPLLGCDLSEMSLLFNKILLNNTPVVIMLDNEMRHKAMKFARKLMSYNVDVRIASTGEFKDPGMMTKNQVIEALKDAKEPDWESMFTLKLENIMKSRKPLWRST